MAHRVHQNTYLIVQIDYKDQRKGARELREVRIPVNEYMSDIPLYGDDIILKARVQMSWPSDYAALILQQLELVARTASPPDKRELAGAHVHTWGNDGQGRYCLLCGTDRVEWLEQRVELLTAQNTALLRAALFAEVLDDLVVLPTVDDDGEPTASATTMIRQDPPQE